MENGGVEPDLSEAVVPTPIAQLQPDLSDIALRIIDGEVTITWPFSIVTKSIAFKLAEHDFLLRRNKGQVRVEFHEAAGKAVAAAGIGAGDKIRLGLVGVEWTEGAPAATRPDTLQWQMSFSSRLCLRLRRADSQEDEPINVDPSHSADDDAPLIELPAPQVSEPERLVTDAPDASNSVDFIRPGPRSSLTGKRQVSEAFGADEYSSPAFLKRARVSYGSLFEGGFDIFNEDDDDLPQTKGDKKKKRPRFSMNANWKYTSRTPSPEPEVQEGSDEASEVLMETPSRLPFPSEAKSGETIDGVVSLPTAEKATETNVSQVLSTPSSPCIPRTALEEEPQDHAEEIMAPPEKNDSSLQLPGLSTQSELDKTGIELDSPLDNGLPKAHDIMDQFLHDNIDPALNDDSGEATDLVMDNDPGGFLEDHSLQFTPISTYPDSQPPTTSFSHLPDDSPHETETFSPFPAQADDWLPMPSASMYPPISAPNSLDNPVEIIDSSSSAGEESPDVSDAENEEREDHRPELSLKSYEEGSDRSHMEDSEQEALQQGREDFQMDDNESEEGADVLGEDYDLRNYDDAQDDDESEGENEDNRVGTATEAENPINAGNEQGPPYSRAIDIPAGAISPVPLNPRADSASDEEDEEVEEEEAGEEVEEEEEEYGEMDEEENYYDEGEEEYDEEGYDDEDDEEEDEETDNSPQPPRDPVIIDLLSDSEDEEEPAKEEHKGNEEDGDADKSPIPTHQKELLDDKHGSREPTQSHTQSLTEEPALADIDTSEQPVPAHAMPSNPSATEDSVSIAPETLLNTNTQSPTQSSPIVAPDFESHVELMEQNDESQEMATISNEETQTQTVVGLDEQRLEILLDEPSFEATQGQEVGSHEASPDFGLPSIEDAAGQHDKDGTIQKATDGDTSTLPPTEQPESMLGKDKEHATASSISEQQPATSNPSSAEATQPSLSLISKLTEPATAKESTELSIGKASPSIAEQGPPALVASVPVEAATNTATVSGIHVPELDSTTSAANEADAKNSSINSPPHGQDLDSVAEDTEMEEAPPVLNEMNQAELLQQDDTVRGEINVDDGLASPPPTEASQQAKTAIEVGQPTAVAIEIDEKVIYVDSGESNPTQHDSKLKDPMEIDEADDEHTHDAEYSFAAEQQIITESQEYQDQSMTDTLQHEVDVSMSVPSESGEKEHETATKPEPDMSITVQSLRSRGHRKSLSSDSTSARTQDPSILLAKANTGTAEPDPDMLITVQSLRSRGHHKSLSSDSTSTRNRDPSVLLAKANTGTAEPDRRRKQKTPPVIHTGRITRSKAEPKVGQMTGSPHTPTRSTRHGATPETPHGSQASGVTRKGRSKSPASTLELPKTPSVAESSVAAAAAAGDEPVSELKLRLLRDLRNNLGDFTPLKSLRNLASKTTDILAIATATPPQPSRPKNGPRDYMVELILTDPSSAPSAVVVAHFFRPHQASLPTVHAGDVVLLRRFQVVSVRKRGFGIRTSDTSAWAVFEKGDEEMLPQIKGPPVELSDAEISYAEGLRRWWALLDEKAKVKIGKSTEKAVQLAKSDEK